MSDREYLSLFAKRPGMYIGRVSLLGVTAFLEGFDFAARRFGGPGRGLDGWRDWLMANHQVSDNLVWEAQIREIALPGWQGGWELSPEAEADVLAVLFELLDTFLAGRDGESSTS
ncbi:hypothetical protein ACIBSV_48885 [Embleya sp. NPDC050154]|uniref:hypothetical protein n=1 Tax=Embleya sp. NPDC050154 TaxID=3363988 RepID=UPI00379F80CA